MSEPNVTKRQQVWLDHLRAAETREMTLVAYATENELRPGDLYNWKSKFVKRGVLKANGDSGDFAAVRLQRTIAACAVQFPNGTRVEFATPLSAQLVELVLSQAARVS